MRVVESTTKRIVTLELTGEDIQKVKGAWSTFDTMLQVEEQELTKTELTAIDTAMYVLGLLA